MTWQTYGTYLAFAGLLVLAPGPDFAVVTKNALTGGRRRGLFTSAGVVSSNVVQGSAAALGLGAVIVSSQLLFETLRWVGVAYLTFLALQALRSAWRPPAPAADRPGPVHDTRSLGPDDRARGRGGALAGWRQGFLSNITNPKVLAFYLSVLPQFLGAASSAGAAGSAGSTTSALLLAYTHAALSLAWLVVLVTVLHRLRGLLHRGPVRRCLDAVTGVALLGFGIKVATEHR